MAGIYQNGYSSTTSSITYKFNFTVSSTSTKYRVRLYVNGGSSYSSQHSGSTSYSNITVSKSSLSAGTTYSGTAYLQYYNTTSGWTDSGYTCSASGTTQDEPTPSYDGKISSLSASTWFQNSSYPAQGSAKITFTVSGGSGFYVSVNGYTKTLYTNAACTSGGSSSFSSGTYTRYIPLDSLYDGNTSSYYLVYLYDPSGGSQAYKFLYHQNILGTLTNTGKTYNSLTFNYLISGTGSQVRIRLSNSAYKTSTSTSGSAQFTGLSPSTTYTCYLEYNGSSGYTTVASASATTESIPTVNLRIRYTYNSSVIYDTGYVEVDSGTVVTKSELQNLVPSGYLYSSCSVSLPYTVTSDTTITVTCSKIVPANVTLSYQWNGTQVSKSVVEIDVGDQITRAQLESTVPSGYTYSSCSKTLPYTVTGDVTIIIYCNRISYTITYKSNYTGGPSDLTQNKYHNETVTLKGSSAFSRTGYIITSWNTNSYGTGTTYALSSSYTTNSDLILYAVWGKAPIAKFYWDGAEGNEDYNIIYPGLPVTKLTASNWNRFKAKIKDVIDKEGKSWTYTASSAGDTLTATEYDNARIGISKLDGVSVTDLPAAMLAGYTIMAKYFVPISSSANLRDALNKAIQYYNDH